MVDPILICVTADRDTQFDPYSYHYYRPEDYLVKSDITNYALPYTSRSLRVRYQFARSVRPSLSVIPQDIQRLFVGIIEFESAPSKVTGKRSGGVDQFEPKRMY